MPRIQWHAVFLRAVLRNRRRWVSGPSCVIGGSEKNLRANLRQIAVGIPYSRFYAESGSGCAMSCAKNVAH